MATIPQHSGYSVIKGSGTGPNGDRIDVWIEWKVTEQDVDNNRSYVRAYFYAALKSGQSSTTWGDSGCSSSFSVGGVSGTGLKSDGSYDFRSPSTVNSLGTFAGWINHSSDGTKSVTFSGSFTTSSSWITGGSASGSRTLPTIERGLIRVRVSGTWRTGVPYVRVAGTWRRGQAFVKISGVWRRGI